MFDYIPEVFAADTADTADPAKGLPGDGRGHALHRVRIEQVFDAGMKKEIGFLSATHAAFRQQLGHEER